MRLRIDVGIHAEADRRALAERAGDARRGGRARGADSTLKHRMPAASAASISAVGLADTGEHDLARDRRPPRSRARARRRTRCRSRCPARAKQVRAPRGSSWPSPRSRRGAACRRTRRRTRERRPRARRANRRSRACRSARRSRQAARLRRGARRRESKGAHGFARGWQDRDPSPAARYSHRMARRRGAGAATGAGAGRLAQRSLDAACCDGERAGQNQGQRDRHAQRAANANDGGEIT